MCQKCIKLFKKCKNFTTIFNNKLSIVAFILTHYYLFFMHSKFKILKIKGWQIFYQSQKTTTTTNVREESDCFIRNHGYTPTHKIRLFFYFIFKRSNLIIYAFIYIHNAGLVK